MKCELVGFGVFPDVNRAIDYWNYHMSRRHKIMWRPPNWKSPYKDWGDKLIIPLQAYAAYEAGADAMLEALRNKSGNILTHNKRTEIKVGKYGVFVDEPGRVVFIPDED